ncbi:hypothetical protein ABB37_05349 [Leptomonas pyrrhocoris]|uniref:Uncharacterized protein n=1 Tax=Leptomonas pyrrhocoris TaxID=157538 RepID=A0A0M9G090_LEPPY|nr:hypothetical protein ABB37_05349 [Leptomonas pyrrhocoris]KPA79527.1 hypothetical protein ABB37_05349 [Leptomonas pyrrhocoris]|eukprot:XP_015657966.1 hypothetical protein ABB37_05349 [Leptomonas pyrrhocoris]
MSHAELCRRCLMAYTAILVALSDVYLFSNWGMHSSYVAVREEMLAHTDGAGDLEGVAFAESGGAEYLLVLLYFIFHVVILALVLAGRRRNTVMTVACAMLLACSVMYILFYGCLLLQARLERHQSLTSPNGVPMRKPDKPAPYKLTAQDVDRTIASGSAGAEAVVDTAPPGQREGTCQGSGGMGSGAALSYSEMAWTVLETLVDVLAAIVAGPEEENDDAAGVQRYHPDGMPIGPTPPFASIRRTSLLLMSVVGFVLSLWGVMTFDLGSESVARASNPGLTASALSQLSSSPAGATGRNGRQDRSDERRRARVATATQEELATSAATDPKKNQ